MALDTRNLQARIEFLPSTKIAYVRHVGPYTKADATFKRFVTWCERRGLINADTKYMGVCHDDPAELGPEKLRYDCAITVGPDFQPEEDVQTGKVFGGEYGVTTYRGPHADLPLVYEWLYTKWLPTCGREEAPGPTIELYLNDASDTPPSQLLTGICIPLQW